MRLQAATVAVAAGAAAAAVDVDQKRDETGVCGNTGKKESPSRATSSRERKLDTKTISYSASVISAVIWLYSIHMSRSCSGCGVSCGLFTLELDESWKYPND